MVLQIVFAGGRREGTVFKVGVNRTIVHPDLSFVRSQLACCCATNSSCCCRVRRVPCPCSSSRAHTRGAGPRPALGIGGAPLGAAHLARWVGGSDGGAIHGRRRDRAESRWKDSAHSTRSRRTGVSCTHHGRPAAGSSRRRCGGGGRCAAPATYGGGLGRYTRYVWLVVGVTNASCPPRGRRQAAKAWLAIEAADPVYPECVPCVRAPHYGKRQQGVFLNVAVEPPPGVPGTNVQFAAGASDDMHDFILRRLLAAA